MGLPGISAKAAVPVAEPEANVQFGYYKEEGDRMEAEVYHGDFIVPINDFFEFSFSYDWDTYVGATPSYSAPQVMTDVVVAASGEDRKPGLIALDLSATPDAGKARLEAIANGVVGRQVAIAGFEGVINRDITDFNPITLFQVQPRENRDMPIFGAKFYLGDVTIGLSSGVSLEPDFESTFGSINMGWELNNKLTTLSAGYGLTLNDIIRTAGSSGGHHGGGGDENAEDFTAESTFHSINAGLSQVMGKNTLFHLNGSYSNQEGYLSNPYKLVYVRGEITADEYLDALIDSFANDGKVGFSEATSLEAVGPDLFREKRPDERHQWTVSAGINQYIPSLDASLHFDYRYYMDSWDINSHTFEFSWFQNLPQGITVTPSIRYYSQSSADFFAPYFLAPRADGNYSSDYRLSGFGKLSGGISISKQFAKGVRLDAGIEYFSHRGSLKLGGNGVDSYADIDSYLISGSLNVNLASLGRATGSYSQHNMHASHGAHPPAGVMFGHMLGKAGDIMIAYNYMYSDWSGGIQSGIVDNVSEQTIISKACGSAECTFNPKEMIMHMHMFNFMYAPTDWLNLMVMPQILDMNMEMNPLPNSGEDEGGEHVSSGLGDTLIVALVKIFDVDTHHLHLGVGVSAPTGSIEATFDDTESEESDLQSYGMQVGSGTWDLKPSLTYNGNSDDWFWGAQITGTKRMQSKNKLGYVLGDEIQGSLWSGYRVQDWFSVSVRNIYKAQGRVRGEFNRIIPPTNPLTEPQPTSLENPSNYGGQFWDIGLGINFTVPRGEFAGHSLSFEWLQPVIHNYNGYQLERDGSLSIRWGYAF